MTDFEKRAPPRGRGELSLALSVGPKHDQVVQICRNLGSHYLLGSLQILHCRCDVDGVEADSRPLCLPGRGPMTKRSVSSDCHSHRVPP